MLCFVALRRPAFLPTVGWLALMAIPFSLQVLTFHLPFAGWQALGVGITLAALIYSDYVVEKHWTPPRGGSVSAAPATTVLLAVGFIAPAVAHIVLADDAPLIQVIAGHGGDWRTLMEQREKSAKLLDAPELVKITFNWAMTVFAPATVIALALRRRWIIAAIVLFSAIAYALLTLARGPIVLLTYTLFIAAWLCLRRGTRFSSAGLAAAAGLLVTTISLTALSHPASFANWRPDEAPTSLPAEKDARLHMTLGDYCRLRPAEVTRQMGPSTQVAEYILYRVFLVPAEVSYRWYQYFSSEQPLGLTGLSPGERSAVDFVHPAQRVATWALVQRFPDKYSDSARAYASVDADAFARFGPVGLLLASLLVVASRLLIGFSCRKSYSLPFQAIGLAMLSILPAVGSLGALWISQGLGLVIAIAFLLPLVFSSYGLPFRKAEREAKE